jgi:colanic acid biosynthesis glycosyl transferase WcaI
MHIVIVTYVYPPEHAPWGVEVAEMAEDFARAGHRVTVVAGWPSHPSGLLYAGWHRSFRHLEHRPEGFDLLRCGHSFGPRKRMFNRLWYYLTFAASSLVNALALGPIDVVVCSSTPIFGPLADWLLAKLKGARLVYDISDLRPEAMATAGIMSAESRSYRVLKALDTWVCRRTDLITTLSENLRRAIAARGVDSSKIRIIPFWLDGRKIQPADRDNPWRRQQGIAPETFVALFAGTIGYVSGAEMLADVAAALAARKDILLLVVGEGPVKDKLQAAAMRLGLSNMRFLPFQPASVLGDMQATADAGIITLLPEAGENSVPSKMLGYLAAGRPVIAGVHETSPTAEALRQGRCGMVVPPQDAPAMAEAIARLADDRRQAARLGRNARQYFLQCFERQGVVRQWQEALTAVVRRGRADNPLSQGMPQTP